MKGIMVYGKKTYSEIKKRIRKLAIKLNSVPHYLLQEECCGSGFPLGTKNVSFKKHYVAKPANVDGHIGIFGGTGTGKSTCIAQNALEQWTAPFVAADLDCELSDRYRTMKLQKKRRIKVINFTRRNKKSSSYDPFYSLGLGGQEQLFEGVIALVNCLIPIENSEIEPFWKEASRDLVAAFIIYYINEGRDFNTTMSFIHNIPHAEIITGIAAGDNALAKALISQFVGVNRKDLANNKMLLSISTTIKTYIRPFATNPTIRAAFAPSKNMLTWDDADKCNIFISVDHERLEQYGGAMRLIFTQLIKHLQRRPNKDASSRRKVKPLLLMMDEFPAYGKMDIMTEALATLRKKGVTIALFAQSLSQFDMIYSANDRKVILDNLSYLAIMRVSEPDSQLYLANRIGYRRTENVSFGKNFAADMKTVTSHTLHRNYQLEYIVTPTELGKLKDIVLVTPEGVCRTDKEPYYEKTQDDIFTAYVKMLKRTVNMAAKKIKPILKESLIQIGAIVLCSIMKKRKKKEKDLHNSLDATIQRRRSKKRKKSKWKGVIIDAWEKFCAVIFQRLTGFNPA